jgi:hypothetical protein
MTYSKIHQNFFTTSKSTRCSHGFKNFTLCHLVYLNPLFIFGGHLNDISKAELENIQG